MHRLQQGGEMAKKATAIFVMVVLHLVTACAPAGPSPMPEPTGTPEEVLATLNLNLGGDPATLDPSLAADTVSQDVIANLFLGLTGTRDDTGEAIVQLATDWEVSQDGLVWTFHLRDDVYWVHYDPQTGVAEKKRQVTAHDVEYGVRRTINPATESPWAGPNHVIKNAEAVNFAVRGSQVSVGVQALDDHTIQFIMQQPASYFPSIASLCINYPQPREVIEEFGARWTEPGNLWTCGPYLLDTWRHRNRIVLVKNAHYYDAGNVAIDRVNFAMVGEALTALHMYENGDLDSIRLPLIEPLQELEQAWADPQLSQELHWEPALLTAAFTFNLTKPPVDNPLVRKALAAAVDKQKLVHDVLRTEHIPAKTFAPPGVFGSPAEAANFAGISFDPEQAREWLAEAGYPDGEGFPELVVMYITDVRSRLAVEFTQQEWRDHLRIKVELVSQEMQGYFQTLREDPPHVFGHAWGADYADENNFVLEVWHPIQSANYSRWDAKAAAAVRFIEVTEAAAAELDPQKRKALYFEAEKILCEDEAIMVPLYHGRLPYLTKPYVERTYNALGQGLARWRVKGH
jgi:oligopeptide transport system substrate-binding protein